MPDSMQETPFNEIDAKVFEFLRKVRAPNVPSQIAVYIHETRDDTLRAVERLTKNGFLRLVPDFTFLNSTGEKEAVFIPERMIFKIPSNDDLHELFFDIILFIRQKTRAGEVATIEEIAKLIERPEQITKQYCDRCGELFPIKYIPATDMIWGWVSAPLEQ